MHYFPFTYVSKLFKLRFLMQYILLTIEANFLLEIGIIVVVFIYLFIY